MIPYIFLMLAIGGIVVGASMVTQVKFGESISSKCYNSTYTIGVLDGTHLAENYCNSTGGTIGASGQSGLNLSDEYYAVVQGKDALTTASEQQGTVAIIAVMVIIISLIAGIFAYIRFFR